jgi:hypothetical protein
MSRDRHARSRVVRGVRIVASHFRQQPTGLVVPGRNSIACVTVSDVGSHGDICTIEQRDGVVESKTSAAAAAVHVLSLLWRRW